MARDKASCVLQFRYLMDSSQSKLLERACNFHTRLQMSEQQYSAPVLYCQSCALKKEHCERHYVLVQDFHISLRIQVNRYITESVAFNSCVWNNDGKDIETQFEQQYTSLHWCIFSKTSMTFPVVSHYIIASFPSSIFVFVCDDVII